MNWLEKIGNKAKAIASIAVCVGILGAAIVYASEKILFYHSLPQTLALADQKMDLLVRIVCKAHPHPDCP